jgi:hypothetical protein
MISRLQSSRSIKVLLFATLALFPVMLHAYSSVAVAGLEGKGAGSAFYISICENLLHEQLSAVHSTEYFDTRAALEQAHARSLTPEERLALIGRSGAELGVTGEIIVEPAEIRFSFAAVELAGERKGRIVVRHHAKVAINPRGSLPETLICREQVMRFLEKLRERHLPGVVIPDYAGEKMRAYMASADPSYAAKLIVFAPFISAFAPIGVTYGYLGMKDYAGLGIAALNAAPYYYLSSLALHDYYRFYRYDERRPGPAERGFLYYNVFAGGLPLFTCYSARSAYPYIRNYGLRDGFLGNEYLALFYSFTGAGSGHFYKGHQFWGHVYYHADTLLIMGAISSWYGDRLSPYLPRGKRRHFAAFVGAAAGVRVLEFVHAYLLPYDILSGTESAVEPFVTMDEESADFGLKLHW